MPFDAVDPASSAKVPPGVDPGVTLQTPSGRSRCRRPAAGIAGCRDRRGASFAGRRGRVEIYQATKSRCRRPAAGFAERPVRSTAASSFGRAAGAQRQADYDLRRAAGAQRQALRGFAGLSCPGGFRSCRAARPSGRLCGFLLRGEASGTIGGSRAAGAQRQALRACTKRPRPSWTRKSRCRRPAAGDAGRLSARARRQALRGSSACFCSDRELMPRCSGRLCGRFLRRGTAVCPYKPCALDYALKGSVTDSASKSVILTITLMLAQAPF